jgi:3-oxoacyl-(acyl-carrier-protein) synthase/acyl carrier protein
LKGLNPDRAGEMIESVVSFNTPNIVVCEKLMKLGSLIMGENRTEPKKKSLSEVDFAEIFRSLLGLSEDETLPEDVALSERGMDSVFAGELREKLNEKFGLSLSATFVYDFPTIRKMRTKVQQLIGGGATTKTRQNNFDAKKFERIVRTLLGIETTELPEDTPLSELGLDSIFATELRTKLNDEFSFALSATFAYDFPTIRKMRKRVEEMTAVSGTKTAKTRENFDSKKFEEIIRSLLGIETGILPEDTALSELGLDSIFASELRTKLNEAFSLSLSATFAYDFPTIRKMRFRIEELSKQTSSDVVSNVFFDKHFNLIVSGLLGLEKDKLPEDTALSELGLDSIFATELRTKLNDEFGLSLSATFAYDFPTIRKMRARVLELIGGGEDEEEETRGVVVAQERKRRVRKNVGFDGSADLNVHIVGCSCRLGSMTTTRELMEVLAEGKDLISVVPSDRWSWKDVFDENNGKNKTQSKWGCFFSSDTLTKFDGEFFGLSPKEVTVMDPQHRMLLETGFEAMENSGKTASDLQGTDMGMYASDYFNRAIAQAERSHVNLGNMNSAAAGRISYFFDLTGECMSIDTACSSSLVAMIQCVKSKSDGFVFGVQNILDPHITVNFSQARMLSNDGRCKTFDASANGYVRAEGCACLMICFDEQPASNVSVIGFAINQDGRSNGLTAPSGPAQIALLSSALSHQNKCWTFLECHGTGTSLGDPIEMQSVEQTKREQNTRQNLLVGSCKANWGHAETAAGILGVLKCIVSFESNHLNKQIHLNVLNKHIGIELMQSARATVPLETVDFSSSSESVVAGISSFAFSGTNAHIVIERVSNNVTNEEPVLQTSISARTKKSLSAMLFEMSNVLKEGWSSPTELLSRKRTVFAVSVPLTFFDLPKQMVSDLETLLSEESTHERTAVCKSIPTYRFERKKYFLDSISTSLTVPSSKQRCFVHGFGLRFSTACNASQFWDLIATAKDCVEVVPSDRFDWKSMYDVDGSKPGKCVSKWGSFISNVWHFDAAFFSISPRQASVTDPNARLLMETSFEAVSNSNHDSHSLNKVGVFIGIAGSDYYESLRFHLDDASRQFVNVSNFESATAGRISYFFGFSGECLAIDTACSSALVALVRCFVLRDFFCFFFSFFPLPDFCLSFVIRQ